jgi:hypothetical protein
LLQIFLLIQIVLQSKILEPILDIYTLFLWKFFSEMAFIPGPKKEVTAESLLASIKVSLRCVLSNSLIENSDFWPSFIYFLCTVILFSGREGGGGREHWCTKKAATVGQNGRLSASL